MAKFMLGQLLATCNVAETTRNHPDFADFVWRSLERYKEADWGEMDPSDLRQNDEALKNGDNRIFAAYIHPDRPDWKIWIITEWDRSATTVLFPDEY